MRGSDSTNRSYGKAKVVMLLSALFTGGVQDRTIYEDSVFARMLNKAGLIDDRDYRTYASLVTI